MTTYPTHRPSPVRMLFAAAVLLLLLPVIVRELFNEVPTDEA